MKTNLSLNDPAVSNNHYKLSKITIMKNYESLDDAITDLKKRGYIETFEPEADCLYCGDLDPRLYPGQFHVDEVYSFHEYASPEDKSVVYAISSSSGAKGTLVDTH